MGSCSNTHTPQSFISLRATITNMNILFIGDSLTKGRLGVNFLKLLRNDFSSSHLKNSGVDGDTFSNISRRLFEELHKRSDYDCVVLQGGYNDIILPYFSRKGRLFESARRHQLKKGLVPLSDASSFEQQVRDTVRKLKTIYTGKIILVTLGCINEYQPFELNARRLVYNSIIRQIATEEGIALADVGHQFDIALSTLRQKDYFLESFWNVVITDRIVSCVKAGPDFLSKQRGLNLTIDGVHLNTKGARIFADCIAAAIKNKHQTAHNSGLAKAGLTNTHKTG
jgi:lysophospholipase L1-like esterase